MKIHINEHVSQWQTVEYLSDWMYNNNIEVPKFIVDIGAADGKLNSNSWNFIVDNDWSGLLIEPNPHAVVELEMNYEDVRRDVNVLDVAVSDKAGDFNLYLPKDPKDDQLASIAYNPQLNTNRFIKVKTIRPRDLPWFEMVGVLTVDTEGHDLNVLTAWIEDGLALPDIILTESWPHLGYKNLQKQSLLGRVGYRKILHCGENEIFYKG